MVRSDYDDTGIGKDSPYALWRIRSNRIMQYSAGARMAGSKSDDKVNKKRAGALLGKIFILKVILEVITFSTFLVGPASRK